ncbi:phosphopantetheine-binding protein [Streptomyces sp. M10(2022)]
MAAIWTDVLGIDHIGIHDNFFDLGGHSLLLAEVRSRISAMMAITLPWSRSFNTPRCAP